MPMGWIKAVRAIRVLVALLFAIYNLVPLYGLWAWHWDAFQLLILYWSETLVLAAWTMVRIAFVPTALLGNMTINGCTGPATHASLIGLMSLTAGVFCAGHLWFLFVLFSGDWFRRLHGIGDFLRTFYIDSDAWIPLVLVTLAGGVEVLFGEYHPQFVDVLAQRLRIVAVVAAPPNDATGDPVGNIIGGLLGRIVVMQVAIICGAWLVRSWGSIAPLAIIVGLKTLIDFGQRAAR
jgi:Family of unknown function (DUF6498)